MIAMDGTWNRLAGGKSRAICAMEVFTILFYFWVYDDFEVLLNSGSYFINIKCLGVDMGPKRISCDENKILKDIEQDIKDKFEN